MSRHNAPTPPSGGGAFWLALAAILVGLFLLANGFFGQVAGW